MMFDAAHAYNKAFNMRDLLRNLKDYLWKARKKVDKPQKNQSAEDMFECV
jgi:hypothetical protein